VNTRSEWRTRHLRLAVANRDGWRCYRCGQPIDPTLRYPHRMSVTLEHVLPEGVTLNEWVRAGGDPYSPAHCSVSHSHCNYSHGATTGNQLRQPRRTALTW
jgi:hypothetical protein